MKTRLFCLVPAALRSTPVIDGGGVGNECHVTPWGSPGEQVRGQHLAAVGRWTNIPCRLQGVPHSAMYQLLFQVMDESVGCLVRMTSFNSTFPYIAGVDWPLHLAVGNWNPSNSEDRKESRHNNWNALLSTHTHSASVHPSSTFQVYNTNYKPQTCPHSPNNIITTSFSPKFTKFDLKAEGCSVSTHRTFPESSMEFYTTPLPWENLVKTANPSC